jgi:hypothetical protein
MYSKRFLIKRVFAVDMLLSHAECIILSPRSHVNSHILRFPESWFSLFCVRVTATSQAYRTITRLEAEPAYLFNQSEYPHSHDIHSLFNTALHRKSVQHAMMKPDSNANSLCCCLTPTTSKENKQQSLQKVAGKSVHFALEVYSDDKIPEKKLILDDESKQELWYQSTDLLEFNLQAMDFADGLRSVDHSEEHGRGFERYREDRIRHKTLTVKSIVLAHKRGMDDESLAVISKRCSHETQEQSFVLGCEDYLEAYHPNMTHLKLTRNSGDPVTKSPVQETTEAASRKHTIELTPTTQEQEQPRAHQSRRLL